MILKNLRGCIKLNTVQSTIGFLTLLFTFFGNYKEWLFFCIGGMAFLVYKAFFEHYSPSQELWKKFFWGACLVAVLSNVYFWFDTKQELENQQKSKSSIFPR